LGSGYPALVALSVTKMKYTNMRGSFTKKGVESFINGLVSGKEGLGDLRVAPKWSSVNAWDGRDAKPQVSDDFWENEQKY